MILAGSEFQSSVENHLLSSLFRRLRYYPSVLNWLKRKSPKAPAGDVIATQPPGEFFRWPKGAVLTAIDEMVLAIPVGLFEKDRPMSEFVFGSNEMQISVPPESDTFYIRLMPAMSVSFSKSVEARIIADDRTPRRIKVTMPPAANKS